MQIVITQVSDTKNRMKSESKTEKKIKMKTRSNQMNEMNETKTHIRGGNMRNVFLILSLATAAFFTTGCLNNEEQTPAESNSTLIASDNPKVAFKAGQEIWADAKPTSYSYQLSRNCFCFPYGRMEVFVDQDEVTKVDTIQGVEGPYDLESFRNAPNIDQVFGQIQGFLNNPDYEVKASYDAKMGYPISVKIHHVMNYVDADADFQIANFRPTR